MNYTGINMEDVKRCNRGSILGIIAKNGPVSRKKLSELTGLTPASVTLLCREMIDQGMLIETGDIIETIGAGRRQVLLDLNVDYCSILSANIESEDTFIVLTNLKSECLAERKIKTDHHLSPEDFLKLIAAQCREILEEHPAQASKLRGISVGLPGLVDKAKGMSVHAFGLWDSPVPVCRILHELMNIPVIIENNVNALAFAELFYDSLVSSRNFLLIKWGPGVGSTIVINQQVYESSQNMTAELGHMIVKKDGNKCSCGKRGCLETVISYQALSKIVPFDMDSIEEAYERSKGEKRSALNDALDIFARTIVNAMTLLAPEKVILCGRMFHSPLLREKLINACAQYNPSFKKDDILYTEFDHKEVYIGPVSCFIQKELFQK